MKTEQLKPVHPGEVLMEDFLLPMNLSQTKLASCLGVPPRRINEIVLGLRGITADTALRLSRFFGTSAELWTGLQSDFELDTAKLKQGKEIIAKVPRYSAILAGRKRQNLRSTSAVRHLKKAVLA